MATTAFSQVLIYEAGLGEVTYTQDWADHEDIDNTDGVLLVFDLEKDLLRITNGFEDKFFIRNSIDLSDEGSERSDKMNLGFYCVDKEGRDCEVLFSYFKNEEVRFGGVYVYRIRIFYPGIWYGYYCNLISEEE